ncbi:MAG: hypothetical protein HRT88_11035 [Lentisphaeraceae bacterium]|nr:hypothetical protein [Lentisphaeraceae bacterium]
MKTATDNNASYVRSFPYVAQLDKSDCGAACLCMVAQYYGRDVLLSEVRNICGSNASAQGLCEAAESFGLKGSYQRKTLEEALRKSGTLVAHWEGEHWVVVSQKKDGSLLISDPAFGQYELSLLEALKKYSGYVCIFSCGKSVALRRKRRDHLRTCLIPFKKAIMRASAIMLLMILAEIWIVYLVQQFLDESLLTTDIRSLSAYVSWAGGAAIGIFMAHLVQGFILNTAAQESEKLVLNEVLIRWLYMPKDFFKERSFGELRNRIECSFEISKLLVTVSGGILFSMLEFVAVVALMEYYQKAMLFAITLIPALIMTLLGFYVSKRYSGRHKMLKESFLKSLDEVTQGAFDIRANAAEAYFLKRESSQMEEMYAQLCNSERMLFICEKGALALAYAAAFVVFYISANEYALQIMSTGSLVAVMLLTVMGLRSLLSLMNQRHKYEHFSIVQDYLNDVFEASRGACQSIIETDSGELSAEGLSFSHETKNFNEIDFRIDKCEHVFLCGDSAAGFVSFLAMDNREYKGHLFLRAGSKEYEAKRQFPLVSQMNDYPYYFDMDLVENIALGEVDIDVKKVRWCMRLALLDDLSRNGHRIHIREVDIDEYQLKKIQLARCLYKKRPLYIFEQLSEFLTESECLIFGEHLKKHMRDKTVLIFDDNYSLLRASSRIFFFEGGVLKVAGKLSKIIETNEDFRNFYKVNWEEK